MREKFICSFIPLGILSFSSYFFAGDMTIYAGLQNPKDRLSTLQFGRTGPREVPFDTSLGSVGKGVW
ncbi:MAG: hypothetical protein DMG05_19425 [Acidobacteria bacterium]|nr:MAG: hypothetical protein DMG05_19425 [Acidobacteriota bacterium]